MAPKPAIYKLISANDFEKQVTVRKTQVGVHSFSQFKPMHVLLLPGARLTTEPGIKFEDDYGYSIN